jgi:transcriptional regulator with PAS, ATPase and Fis domain
MANALSTEEEFIGVSPVLRQIQAQLREVAQSKMTVLILGETGTGKSIAAHYVHEWSRWKTGPFIPLNCGGIAEGLVESELFGHEKGAFTGAIQCKPGKIESAQEGTLFLDEIGDMPMAAQVKLLRLLEEKTFERVGGTQIHPAQVRVIAATNQPLERMVQEGTFRADLYYRLWGYPIQLPPLRERLEDILPLAQYFMKRKAAHLGRKTPTIHPQVAALLQAYDWPGNVREIKNTLERAVLVCQGGQVQAAHLHMGCPHSRPVLGETLLTLEEYERLYICQVLEKTRWTIKGSKGAASLLGLHPATLYSRMKKLDIQRPRG